MTGEHHGEIGRPARRSAVWLVVIGLLLMHAALAITSNVKSSATFDEVAHLVAGYSYLHTGDFRLTPEHPPLAEMWSALPLALTKPEFPSTDQEDWWSSATLALGVEFVYKVGNDPETLLLIGRCMTVVLSVALGLVVFLWSRHLFGTAGGLLSLALYALSPTMLAHAPLITTDMAAALFFATSTVLLWSVLHRVTIGRVLISSLAVSALLLTKFSGVSIIAIAGVIVLVRLASRRPIEVAIGRRFEVDDRVKRLVVICLAAACHVLVVVVCLWALYGFRYEALENPVPGRDRFATFGFVSPYESSWNYELRKLRGSRPVIQWVRENRLVPEAFLYGFVYAVNSTSRRQAFLRGERSIRGFPAFFPYAFLIKTPLPLFGVLILAAVGAGGILRARRETDEDETPGLWYDTTPLWALLVVYWLFAVTSHLNIGHRHLLPVYPVLFVLSGAAAGLLRSRRRLVRITMPVMVGTFVLASLLAWPHYLAYFNSLIGGPKNAYRHLVDSSVDWGQDLGRLAGWLEDRELKRAGDAAVPPADTVYLARFGNTPLEHYGINAKVLATPPQGNEPEVFPLGEGVYCISASMLQQISLLPMSRWTPALERLYQMCLPTIRRINSPGEEGAVEVSSGCILGDDLMLKLRFGRLCAALRSREPDDSVGHSILIYHLSRREVEDALFGPGPELTADEAESLRELAVEVFRTGNVDLVGAILDEVISLNPDDALAHILLGGILTDLGRFTDAAGHFAEALRVDPESAKAYAGAGFCLARLGKHGEAVEVYRQALELDPLAAETFADCGMSLALLGRMEEAIKDFDEAVRLRPLEPALRLVGAGILVQAGELRRAIEHLKIVIALAPDFAEAHLELGVVYGRIEDLESAVRQYRKAIAINPDILPAHYHLGTALAHLGKYEEALAAMEKALELAEASQMADLGERIRDRIQRYRAQAKQQGE